jgi:dienelactone hydrolase
MLASNGVSARLVPWCAILAMGCAKHAPTQSSPSASVGGYSGASGPDVSVTAGASGIGGNSSSSGNNSSGGASGRTSTAAENTAGHGSAGNGGPSNGSSGGNAAAGQSGSGGTVASDCGANLLPVPDDVAVRGPWDVGVRTVHIGRLTVELFYPAQPGSSLNHSEATYSLRDWLPPQEIAKVPEDHSPPIGPIGGHLYRDLPVDDAHGPYPIVIFIHGTASMRIASGSTNTQWASRGFVVLAADYPGLGLTDQLNSACGYPTTGDQDIEGDVNTQLSALGSASGDLAFLAGHLDTTRLGISGHSQGACIAATLSTLPNLQIVIPMAGSMPVSASPSLKSLMFIAGMDDTVIGYDAPLLGNVVCPAGATDDKDAYADSPGPPDVHKRLVGIKGGGHLAVTDLCQKNKQGLNAIDEAKADGVCGIDTAVIIGLPALFDCGSIDWMDGVKAVNYATTAALEETLLCKDRSAQFDQLGSNPLIGDYQHAP